MIEIVIPVRMTSSRLPNKFLQLIGDKTLLEHVYERASLTGFKVTVVADDPEFRRAHPTMNIAIYDKNVHNGTDRVAGYACDGNDEDIIINCQGDLPFIDPQQILAAALAVNYGDVGTLVTEMEPEKQKDPNSVKAICTSLSPSSLVIPSQSDVQHPLRAHWFCRAALEYGYHHIGVYAFKRKTLRQFIGHHSPYEDIERLEQLRWLDMGMTIAAFKTYQIPVEVNTPEDLESARSYYDNLRKGVGHNPTN